MPGLFFPELMPGPDPDPEADPESGPEPDSGPEPEGFDLQKPNVTIS